MPLVEQKLNQTDESELVHFKQVQQAMNARSQQQQQQQQQQQKQRLSMGDAHFNYIYNRLAHQLNIRVTNEEDKYIYLVNKLKDYSIFVRPPPPPAPHLSNYFIYFFRRI